MLAPLQQLVDSFRTEDSWWGALDDAKALGRAEHVLGLLRRTYRGFCVACFLLTAVTVAGRWLAQAWLSEISLWFLTAVLVTFLLLLQPLQRLILHFQLDGRPLRRRLAWFLPAAGVVFLVIALLPGDGLPGGWHLPVLLLTVGTPLGLAFYFLLRIGPSVGVLRSVATVAVAVLLLRYSPLVDNAAAFSGPLLPPAQRPWPSPEIATQPPGARVYVDWEFEGETPLRVQDLGETSHLLVWKEGFVARYREAAASRPYYFKLQAQAKGSDSGSIVGQSVLLRVFGDANDLMAPPLQDALLKRGIFPAALPSDNRFERALVRLEERAVFLAWARTHYHTDRVLTIRLPGSSPGFDPVKHLLDEGAVADPGPDRLQAILIGLVDGEVLSHFTLRSTGLSSGSPESRGRAAADLATKTVSELHRRLNQRTRGRRNS